jgi:hypothetical protein
MTTTTNNTRSDSASAAAATATAAATAAAMTTTMTKETFKQTFPFPTVDWFWETWKEVLLEGPSHNQYQTVISTAQMMVEVIAQKNEEITEKNEEIKKLREKTEDSQLIQDRNQWLVKSASEAAKNESAREKFRSKQVGPDMCRGGFVALQYYLDFVLAAREFPGKGLAENIKQELIQELDGLGKVLSWKQRKENSLYSPDFMDVEAPQSAVAAQLFQMAIDFFQVKSSGTNEHPNRLIVSHQMQIVGKISQGDCIIWPGKPGSLKRSRDEVEGETTKGQPPQKDDSKKKKEPDRTDDRIDICVWFVHKDTSLGACVAAAGEYKPHDLKSEERQAQADMYGSNIFVHHKKPCVIIDIAGGNDLSSWEISATGLVRALQSAPNWEKTPLFSGKGAEAIVSVAWGLVAAKDSFPSTLNNFGRRLGPVVGEHGDFVYKAYDNATTRNPNVDALKFLLGDENVEMMESKDSTLKIVKMIELENDWTQEVNAKDSFGRIIMMLQELHAEYGPHGDIRLANLTSSGYIIDLDFVGRKSYPRTLNNISVDGCRHPDVEAWIKKQDEEHNNNKAEDLEMKESHDWFSLGFAMKLFRPVDESNNEVWEQTCKLFQEIESSADGKGKLLDSLTICERLNFRIKINDKDIPLPGTGHTPNRKQPTKPVQINQDKKHKANEKTPTTMGSIAED